jgi:hypothetical protein
VAPRWVPRGTAECDSGQRGTAALSTDCRAAGKPNHTAVPLGVWGMA